jgi:hypothetical protein
MSRREDLPPQLSHKGVTSGGLVSAKVGALSLVARADRRLVGWGLFKSESRPLVKLQSLLAAVAICVAALFLLTALIRRWYHGAASGSLGVDLLYWIVWIAYTLSKIVLVVVSVATVYQWISTRRK